MKIHNFKQDIYQYGNNTYTVEVSFGTTPIEELIATIIKNNQAA